MGRTAGSGFQHSKERVIVAEVALNKMPNLEEHAQRELIAQIKNADRLSQLKTHLKNLESSSAGASTIKSFLKSIFVSAGQASQIIEEATDRSKKTNDWEFLAALKEKVAKYPLLEQLAQGVVTEAHKYFQKFMKQRFQRLCLRAQDIKQQTMYHQVEAEVEDQDRQRRKSARSNWLNEIKIAQAQVDPGYVFYIV